VQVHGDDVIGTSDGEEVGNEPKRALSVKR
jgi:hypothetical protein